MILSLVVLKTKKINRTENKPQLEAVISASVNNLVPVVSNIMKILRGKYSAGITTSVIHKFGNLKRDFDKMSILNI